ELAAVILDLLSDCRLIVDHESEMMQPGPIRAAFAANGSYREVQEREVHHAVRERDGVADRGLHLGHALELEHAFVERGGLLECGNLDRDMSDLGHRVLSAG